MAVGQASVVEDLQEGVEDIGVRLFDLIEEHDAVGVATYRFGQLTGLVVAHVAGRRADHAADGVPLHVLAHVQPDERLFVVEQLLREGAGQLGLADAGGSQE